MSAEAWNKRPPAQKDLPLVVSFIPLNSDTRESNKYSLDSRAVHLFLKAFAFLTLFTLLADGGPQSPHSFPGGYALPNGWRITPVGTAIETEDMVLNLLPSPDGKCVIALAGGYNPEGLVVIDASTGEAVQRIPLRSAWLGMAWSHHGDKLYVSGGNGNGDRSYRAPIYVFDYHHERLSPEPVETLDYEINAADLYWSGLAHHPHKELLFAANRGTGTAASGVIVFDTHSGKAVHKIPVEVNPYALALNKDGSTLYASNWGSGSVSVIDTSSFQVTATIPAGGNPNDMVLSEDGRLFVACANDNTVTVIDTRTRQPIEKISTALFPRAPEGTTPNALTLDRENQMLFVANADNNDVAVVRVAERGHSEVLGFIPTGWYPSALAMPDKAPKLYVGNSKGLGSFPLLHGPHSPVPPIPTDPSAKALRKGSVNIVDLSDLKTNLPQWTKQVYENTPYRDELLTQAKAPASPSVIPRDIGVETPIRHIVYIIKENRTYDQVLGDIAKGNGDPRLAIFGRQVTPNQHAIAEQFALFDNLYADGEVSADGHSWSDSAYATDFAEKLWPVVYSGRSRAALSNAYVPAGGHIWDLCARKGLTYRSYGEYAVQVSNGSNIESAPGVGALYGHYSPQYRLPGMRDTDNAAVFLKEFDEYEKHFDNPNPAKRLPNFVIMSLPEDHTKGTLPGAYTPVASVANNDYALGLILDRLTHSKYWPQMAIFVIEDDAQDGPDHVDARRTAGFALSPFMRRGIVDSTQYSTSSMLRTMELLLGLPPMSQFDAAATPMYAAFGMSTDFAPFQKLEPLVDVNAKNTSRSYGARRSKQMDFDDVDRAPMFALNEIIWKSVKGADSPMPLPVHRYSFPER